VLSSHINSDVSNKISRDLATYWYAREKATLEVEISALHQQVIRLRKQNNIVEADKCQILLKKCAIKLSEVSLKKPTLEQAQKILNVEEQITSVRKELRDLYGDKIPNDEVTPDAAQKPHNDVVTRPETLHAYSERRRFLLKKYWDFLRPLTIRLHKNINELVPHDEPVEEVTGEKRNPLRAFFDIAKKFIDIIDDIWSVMKGAIPPEVFILIGPFLTGGVGFIINLAEAYQGLKEAWRAKKNNKTIGQPKTRGITGLIIFALGCTGAGLSLAFIASALGAAVSGVALMPALIPIFLISIYSVALFKRSYIFHRMIEEEKKAKVAFDDTLNKIAAIPSPPQEQHDDNFFELHINIECQKQNYSHFREERLKAERNIAFNVIEVLASSIVLIGTIIGISAIVGAASFATMGAAPLAILILGVSIGLFCKGFERFDEKRDFIYTRKARAWVIDLWNHLFHGEKNTPFATARPPLFSTARTLQRTSVQSTSASLDFTPTPPPAQQRLISLEDDVDEKQPSLDNNSTFSPYYS
jgi:hypothetical protein